MIELVMTGLIQPVPTNKDGQRLGENVVLDENAYFDTSLSDVKNTIRADTHLKESVALSSKRVFGKLNHDRINGDLTEKVSGAVENYQSSQLYPGYIEKICGDGKRSIGKMVLGKFVPVTI